MQQHNYKETGRHSIYSKQHQDYIMDQQNEKNRIADFHSFLSNNAFPCVAAKDAMTKGHIQIMTAGNLACPVHDSAILDFIYNFTVQYRNAVKGFYSAAIIFSGPGNINEALFDTLMWQKLQALSDLDAQQYRYDKRVHADPSSGKFSFSLMEEAYFVIALHPGSSRPARKFQYPVLVFNPHAQFEEMKKNAGYEKMKIIVRKRDLAYSGSVNPMLTDFGEASEVYQYSGKAYNSNWECPLKIKHQ